MSSKEKFPTIPSTSPQTLKIGGRVRCSDDGVEGRIVWANAVAVKIQWDDGQQVTWRRDSLASRPIEILEVFRDENEQAATCPSVQAESDRSVDLYSTAPVASGKQTETTLAESFEKAEAGAREQNSGEGKQAEEVPTRKLAQGALAPPEQIEVQSEASTATKRKTEDATGDGKDKKTSALDAAAKVLGETGKPMSCPEMIEAMAGKGYWISPGGKTPQATLYSAIAREISAKGAQSRFVKAERGKFARNGAA